MTLTAHNELVQTAQDILSRTSDLSKQLSQQSIKPPNDLALGARSELWSTHDGEVENLRSSILALTQRLDRLLEGPHGFLHEYISTNWEYGALYTLLEFNIMEKIPLDGSSVSAGDLVADTVLSEEKLLRICRLAATAGILEEKQQGLFSHTAISETLVSDEGYRSFIRFQLYETRIASANLADSLKKPNPFWTGQAAFDYVWGSPMYEWHKTQPEKGKRFAQAMESVSKNLDPGNGMIINWLTRNLQPATNSSNTALLIEVSGKTGAFSRQLATLFPNLHLEVQESSTDLLQRGKANLEPELTDRVQFNQRDLFQPRSAQDLNHTGRTIFLVRSVLWQLEDSKATELLQSFIPALRGANESEKPVLLINDLVSPAFGTFEPHIERAFRRRDVTLMTMHNVKQRTAKEWGDLIQSACGEFKVTYDEKYSSHSCRGLWQVELGDERAEAVNGHG